MPNPERSRLAFVLALVGATVLLLAACGGDDDVAAPPPAEPAPEPAPEPVPEPEEPAPADPPEVVPETPPEEPTAAGEEFTSPTGVTCTTREPEAVSDRPTFTAPPEFELEDGVTYSATLETSCGTIVLELDAVAAPITTNNFVVLSRSGFYDGITFHRAVPGFVIQGGDPLGNGFGGPGYEFEDELPTDGYALGDLAMANAGPNTNGSQFFIVTGDASALPNDFSKFGRVVEGLDVAQGIESLGDLTTQMPIAPVYIYSVEITES